MKPQSLISILIPAYNHEKYVEGCVRSVLEQDWPSVELLVVDDGSRDATWAKLQGLKAACEGRLARVEMVTQENRGTSFTWARLRDMARGEFILTLASDDELAPGALSALVGPMLRDRRIGVVVGQNAFMDGEGRTCYWNRALETVYDEAEARYRSLNEAICAFAGVKQFSRHFGDYGRLLKDNYIANGCLIRASELAAVEFPAEQVPLEDYWVHLQLSKRTRYKAIRETTFRYRWHATNTSHLREKMQEMTRRIYDFEEERLRTTGDARHLGILRKVREESTAIRLGGRVKKKYDLALAMGYACSCAQALRAAGLEFASFPFDWAAPLGPNTLAGLVETICNDFTNWFEKEDLVLSPQDELANWETSEADAYHNRRTGYFFPHDFAKGADFGKAYDRVAEKYRRRIARLYELLKSAKRVLLVRIDSPVQGFVTTAESCVDARARLMAKFPGVAFDFIYLTIDPSRPFAERLEEEVSEGVVHVAFDYACHRPGAPGYMTETQQVVKVLRSRAKVRDYRTREERQDYVRKRRRARWAKYGAKSFWGYQLARIRRAFSK